jgi:hypothetical protein
MSWIDRLIHCAAHLGCRWAQPMSQNGSRVGSRRGSGFERCRRFLDPPGSWSATSTVTTRDELEWKDAVAITASDLKEMFLQIKDQA